MQGDWAADASVRDVIESLLRTTLRTDQNLVTKELIDRVRRRLKVAPHLEKLWKELSETEIKDVAREVGLVAREAIRAQLQKRLQ